MAILLGCDSVHLEFPTKLIAQDVTLGVNEGDRIGIVGKNGDGKSSLLGVLSGAVPPDAGRVTRRRDVTVGVLGQRDALDSASTVHRANFPSTSGPRAPVSVRSWTASSRMCPGRAWWGSCPVVSAAVWTWRACSSGIMTS